MTEYQKECIEKARTLGLHPAFESIYINTVADINDLISRANFEAADIYPDKKDIKGFIEALRKLVKICLETAIEIDEKTSKLAEREIL